MIKVKNLNNTYITADSKIEVLNNINIYCDKNEFVSIIGPSGCGKSTLFKILAGLIKEYTGDINIEDKIIYMHQKDNLMPWRKVYKNIILPYEINKVEINKEKIFNLAKEFELDEFLDMYPHQLSGGMRKKVSLLRTYITGREIMLLDEPFGSLDALTRKALYSWLLKIWNKHKKTVLFITHDIEEAIYLSDRIYVMNKRPATIVDEIHVKFNRSRNQEMLLSSKFLEYKRRLEKSLTK